MTGYIAVFSGKSSADVPRVSTPRQSYYVPHVHLIHQDADSMMLCGKSILPTWQRWRQYSWDEIQAASTSSTLEGCPLCSNCLSTAYQEHDTPIAPTIRTQRMTSQYNRAIRLLGRILRDAEAHNWQSDTLAAIKRFLASRVDELDEN